MEICLGTKLPVGSRRWSRYCSEWPQSPSGPKGGGNRPNVARNDPKRSQTPLRSTRSNPPSMTNDAPMERCGPWETQHGAYHGSFGAVLSRFAHPEPHFGLMRAETVIWPCRGLLAQISIPRALVPGTTPPPHTLFVVSTPQNGPNTHLDPSCGSHLSIWPHGPFPAISGHFHFEPF